MKRVRSGGGWPAVRYALRKAREAGGLVKMWKAMRRPNACKTCALGMGGQRGGMVNELGRFPEVCKKALQAQAADMQRPIPREFWREHPLSRLEAMSPRELEACGRLAEPLLLECGAAGYRPLGWDETLERVARRLKETRPEETFWYFSGRSSNEAGFLLQLFARVYGTNHVNNCSYYCHQASGVGLSSAVGSGTATVVLDDVEHADLIFLIGANPPSNHPRLMKTLLHARRRGAGVVVINPVVETGLVSFRVPSDARSLLFGTRIATLYVQPHIGGDLALLSGIAKRIDELGARDDAFLRDHCEGSEALLERLRETAWEVIEAGSGIARAEVDVIARKYAASERAVFCWTMGITHHAHGVQNVQAIANLALLRGMVGRPGAGLLPIRGHSNVQGIGSVGVTPRLKDAVLHRLEEELGVRPPDSEGLDTLGCMEAAHEGKLRLGVCLGGNLYGSNPDSRYAREALSRLGAVVYLSTTLNTGHAHGTGEETIVLPVLARDEEPQPTTQESMFNFVRMSDGGPARFPGPRSEVEVISRLAREVLGTESPIDWAAMAATGRVRDAIARVVPGYEKLARIDATREEFQIGGRTFHEPRFATGSGRARLHAHELPELGGTGGELRLMTVRSEGQFNTVVYEEGDLYRHQERRDVILLHPDDLARLGLRPDQPVTVRSETGRLENILARSFPEIRAGNALMYFPEANALVSRHADPRSRTPAFKGALVRVEG